MYEVMLMTDTLRDAILGGEGPVEIKRAALRGGMRSLRKAGLMKLKKGEISFEQLVAMTVSDEVATK